MIFLFKDINAFEDIESILCIKQCNIFIIYRRMFMDFISLFKLTNLF